MAAEEAAFLDYRAPRRAAGIRPGKHAARDAGSGGDLRAVRPFWQMPDARRIDMRRSIMDPAGTIMVRQTDRRSSVTLVLAADVSRSMAPSCIAPLAAAAARSACRAGDGFGLVCFDETIRDDIGVRATRRRSTALTQAAALAAFAPSGRNAEGLRDVAACLSQKSCVVLLVSDFLMPLTTLQAALHALARHAVTPVVIDNLPASIPAVGLCRVRDAESGRTRLLFMRPALARRWREATAARRDALRGLFARNGLLPFEAGREVDIGALSRHLVCA